MAPQLRSATRGGLGTRRETLTMIYFTRIEVVDSDTQSWRKVILKPPMVLLGCKLAK